MRELCTTSEERQAVLDEIENQLDKLIGIKGYDIQDYARLTALMMILRRAIKNEEQAKYEQDDE